MGRPSKGERALSAKLFARLTPQQHDRYLALGGSQWLRDQLNIAEGRQRLAPTPTAHNPFVPSAAAIKAGRPLRFGCALTERREVRLTPDQDKALDRLGGQDFLRGVLQIILAREAAERCESPSP